MGSEGGTADVAWQHGHCILASTCASAAAVLLVVVAVTRAGDVGSVAESSKLVLRVSWQVGTSWV